MLPREGRCGGRRGNLRVERSTTGHGHPFKYLIGVEKERIIGLCARHRGKLDRETSYLND